LDLVFDDLGLQTLKNIPRPIRLFHVNSTVGSIPTTPAPKGPARKPSTDRRAAGAARFLFALALLAVAPVVVIYVLTAKAFGVFLGHLDLLGIWVTVICVSWFVQRLIAARSNYTDPLSPHSKAAAPAGKSARW
jgi:hypothetical protein